MSAIVLIIVLVIAFFVVVAAMKSINVIGPTEVGLVTKRFSFRKLGTDNPIAFHGEAGYQAALLHAGVRFKLWPIFAVKKFPWVQVPAGEIAVVVAQVGAPLPIGAKSAAYKTEFGNFSNLAGFINGGGQKGVQRPVLTPGTLLPIHPVAFLVITSRKVYGLPVSPDLAERAKATGGVMRGGVVRAFARAAAGCRHRAARTAGHGWHRHDAGRSSVGVGRHCEPLGRVRRHRRDGGGGRVESRLGGHRGLLGSKNELHNNYQDYQLFMDNGGHIGLQHDPLLYGAYLLNPFLVRVEMVPMLVVNQGEVAVIKAYVGLPTLDTSGVEFKFGSIVRPGHRGIWAEPLRTGKYPINPRVYAAEIVPTSILTLNWAEAVSTAHNLDAHLSPIEAKSREGFVFRIDLQVQIHVPDTRAPKVISMVGTMQNLVNEVLQAAVGNHFRNTVQGLEAVRFIETRAAVQESALEVITAYLAAYDVETRGVYIQDVEFPIEMVTVLTKREIANQEKATYAEMQRAEVVRIETEKARGTADMQASLAQSAVGVEIKNNEADARAATARGEAAYVELTGRAEAAKIEAIGLAEGKATEALGLGRATGYEAQTRALGQTATALVAVANAVSEGKITVVPEVLVAGGGGAIEGLAATLMRTLGTNGSGEKPADKPADAKVVEAAPAK